VNERLYRSRSDRMIAGVAGGLADMWDADPSLIRIIWVILVPLTGGLALLVYLVMAIVVPEEDEVWPAAPIEPVAPPTPEAPGPAGQPGAAAEGQPAAMAGPPTGTPASAPPPEPGALWSPAPADARRAAQMQARAARRAARANRSSSGGVTGALVVGLLLIALGGFFLVREWWPQFDFDWFWPVMLIVLGIVMLIAAIGRNPGSPGGPS